MLQKGGFAYSRQVFVLLVHPDCTASGMLARNRPLLRRLMHANSDATIADLVLAQDLSVRPFRLALESFLHLTCR